jgi:hypothetical protein
MRRVRYGHLRVLTLLGFLVAGLCLLTASGRPAALEAADVGSARVAASLDQLPEPSAQLERPTVRISAPASFRPATEPLSTVSGSVALRMMLFALAVSFATGPALRTRVARRSGPRAPPYAITARP